MLLLLYVNLSNYKKIHNFLVEFASTKPIQYCSTTGKPMRSFATERVSLDSV
jgi:hypothetical protein